MPSRWRKEIIIGHGVDGKPIRKTFGGKTKREVLKKIDDYKLMVSTGGFMDEKIAFENWSNRWISTYKDGNVPASTYYGYDLCIKHLNVYFGKTPMTYIKPIDVQNFFNEKKIYLTPW